MSPGATNKSEHSQFFFGRDESGDDRDFDISKSARGDFSFILLDGPWSSLALFK